MKVFLIAVVAVACVGCATNYTPEQLRAMDEFGQEMQQAGQAFQPRGMSSSKTCHQVDLGGGMYREDCY